MLPSEVRKSVLAQHGALRVILNDIELAAGRLDLGEQAALATVLARAELLVDEYEAHIAFEEQEMLPFIADSDSYGSVRVARILDEHAGQRALFGELRRRLGEADRPEMRRAVAQIVRELAAILRIDMDAEEALTVNDKLLRDDVIAIDQCTG